MTIKRVLYPERIRQIPLQFSWVDHRLIRDRHIDRCDPPAAALYLMLVTVADAQRQAAYRKRFLKAGMRERSFILTDLEDARLREIIEAWRGNEPDLPASALKCCQALKPA